MWTKGRAQMSGSEEDSILKMENCFRSAGIGESEIGYLHLYPNRWVFSIKIQDPQNW